MTEWDIFLTLITIVTFMGMVIKVSNVIQKNTDAIDSLKNELKSISDDNKKDHKNFTNSINHLNEEVTIIKTKMEIEKE